MSHLSSSGFVWAAAAVLVASCSIVGPLDGTAARAATSAHRATTDTGDAQLERRQALAQIQLAQAQRDETRQAAISAHDADRPWRVLLPLGVTLTGALVTALVAYLAIVLPLRRQREKDRIQRRAVAEQDAKHRRKELVQRFDADFARAVSALADPSHAAQAGGAAALRSFLRPDLGEFRDQTYQITRAHLDRRIDHPAAVRSILVAALVHLLRDLHGTPTPRSASRTASTGPPPGVDLTWVWLRRADLRRIDLAAADLWRSDLRAARLDGSSLRRARAWKSDFTRASFIGADLEEARLRTVRAEEAVFDGARLVSARLEETILDKARFRGAELQSAHFLDATLRGADFRDADVRDALFTGAVFDDAALASLVLARDIWKADPDTGRGYFTARFDPNVRLRLHQLARQRGWAWVPA